MGRQTGCEEEKMSDPQIWPWNLSSSKDLIEQKQKRKCKRKETSKFLTLGALYPTLNVYHVSAAIARIVRWWLHRYFSLQSPKRTQDSPLLFLLLLFCFVWSASCSPWENFSSISQQTRAGAPSVSLRQTLSVHWRFALNWWPSVKFSGSWKERRKENSNICWILNCLVAVLLCSASQAEGEAKTEEMLCFTAWGWLRSKVNNQISFTAGKSRLLSQVCQNNSIHFRIFRLDPTYILPTNLFMLFQQKTVQNDTGCHMFYISSDSACMWWLEEQIRLLIAAIAVLVEKG